MESPGFFLENSRTWKVLKNILENDTFFHRLCFFHRLKQKSFFLPDLLADYLQSLTFNFVVLVRDILTFAGYEKVLENCSWGCWKVLDCFSVKEWEPCNQYLTSPISKQNTYF